MEDPDLELGGGGGGAEVLFSWGRRGAEVLFACFSSFCNFLFYPK